MLTRQARIIAGSLLGAALLVGTASGWLWWRERRQAAVALAALPAVPELADWPADYAVRVRVATAAVRRGEQPVAALRELALLYHANGRYREAAQAERALETLEPENARWDYFRADASEKLGDSDTQRALLEKTLQLAPYYGAARIRLADLLLKVGEPDRARSQYERYLAQVPGEPHARLGLARIQLDGGDRDGAIQALAGLVRDHPEFLAAHNLLAEVYAAAGDAAQAEAQRRLSGATGEGQREDDPWLHWLDAWSFDPYRIELAGGTEAQARVLEGTLDLYRRLAAAAPDDSEACDALGGLYLQLNRPDEADTVLKQGIGRTPAAAELYSTLARALRRQGRLDEAMETLRRGLRAAPAAPMLPYELGLLLEKNGRREEARSLYQESVHQDPGFADAHWHLGLCFLALGRPAEAKSSLGDALRLRPQKAGALLALAQDALAAGELPKADCCLQVLVDCSPGMPVRSLVERGLTLARRAGDEKSSGDFARLLAQPLQ